MAHKADLFIEVTKQLRAGRTLEELSAAINQLVNECRNTGKKGELIFKLTMKPDKGDSGQYFLNDEITVKAPKFERGQTLMFGTPDGNLQRTDPNQLDMDLKIVREEQIIPRFVDQPSQTPKKVN